MPGETSTQEQWFQVIARALSYLCINATDLRDADLTRKAVLLEGLGLPRRDVATLLGTTEDIVRVQVNAAKRGGARKRRGKGKKK
jgi:hypothetical protein